MKQLKVSLNTKQRADLERSAKESGRSLSEEIRRRLETSLVDDEKFSVFARLIGEETTWLAQMVMAAALENDQIVDATEDDWKKIAPTVQRALVVALSEWWGPIRFGQPTTPDLRADTIGKTAAKNFLFLTEALARRRAADEDDDEPEGET
jgi:hypothetical protein